MLKQLHPKFALSNSLPRCNQRIWSILIRQFLLEVVIDLSVGCVKFKAVRLVPMPFRWDIRVLLVFGHGRVRYSWRARRSSFSVLSHSALGIPYGRNFSIVPRSSL